MASKAPEAPKASVLKRSRGQLVGRKSRKLSAEETPPLLLKLPDELLLMVISKLSRNSDLHQLSLVNRRLMELSQEALVREAVIPKNGIRKFLNMLCTRPDLSSKIISVDLGKYQCGGSPGKISDLDKDNLFRKCRSLVETLNGEGHFSKILKSIGTNGNTLWTANRQYFLDVLVAVTPRLQKLTLEIPSMSPLQAMQVLTSEETDRLGSVRPFQGLALERLRQRLRFLEITEGDDPNSYGSHIITLRSLDSLSRLTIPLSALIDSDVRLADPQKVLPPNLERLQIRPCHRRVLRWLVKFGEAYAGQGFPKLRRIELFFKTCIRSSLLLIDQGQGVLDSFHKLVRLFGQSGLTIVAYSETDDAGKSLFEELEAWSYLSPSEAWLTATKGEQFSATVARAEDGTPRRRTKEEARVFLRGHQPPGNMRTSGDFKPRLTTHKAAESKFGTDVKTTIEEKKCLPDPEAWEQIYAFYNIVIPKSVSDSILANEAHSEGDTASPQPVHDTLTILESFHVPETSSVISSKFNADEWRDVTWFQASKPALPQTPKPKGLNKKSRGRLNRSATAVDQRSPTPRPRRTQQKKTV